MGPQTLTVKTPLGFVGAYRYRFSPIDPQVEGADETPLDKKFWEQCGRINREVDKEISDSWHAVDPCGVVMAKHLPERTQSMFLDRVRTLGQLRKLVAVVMGEG